LSTAIEKIEIYLLINHVNLVTSIEFHRPIITLNISKKVINTINQIVGNY